MVTWCDYATGPGVSFMLVASKPNTRYCDEDLRHLLSGCRSPSPSHCQAIVAWVAGMSLKSCLLIGHDGASIAQCVALKWSLIITRGCSIPVASRSELCRINHAEPAWRQQRRRPDSSRGRMQPVLLGRIHLHAAVSWINAIALFIRLSQRQCCLQHKSCLPMQR